jgi:uncharacterized protein (UPF0333 family)
MKKGQAAMEFLMTYGWAILVVIAAIAALAYFGVLSPDKMLPERTTFQAPIPNVDNAVITAGTATNGVVSLALKNNVGFPINITAVTESGTGGTCGAPVANSVELSIEGGAYAVPDGPTEILNGQGFRVQFKCTNALTSGQKFKDDFALMYTNKETMQTHPHIGSITAKIGP